MTLEVDDRNFCVFKRSLRRFGEAEKINSSKIMFKYNHESYVIKYKTKIRPLTVACDL